MHVVDWSGEPPPVVGIHGSAGHAYGLTALGERLAPDVRFVAVDLRGHGFSDKPPSGYGIQEHVGDLLQMIDALALDKPILLGHSIGGAIATFAAQAAGDRIGGLVLFDAVVGDRRFVERRRSSSRSLAPRSNTGSQTSTSTKPNGAPSLTIPPGDAGWSAANGWSWFRCQTGRFAGAACATRSPWNGPRSRGPTRSPRSPM